MCILDLNRKETNCYGWSLNKFLIRNSLEPTPVSHLAPC
uniref:Uncharacterized protein n=1 Tax=Arundo donax TaxID=35708 RepID=A0A0A8YBZ8_ARUDO